MSELLNDSRAVENADTAAAEEQAGVQGKEERREVEDCQESEKKYTDEDVNRIVSKRLTRERERLSKLFNEEQQESELDIRERNVLKREQKADAKDALIAEGLPSSLADLLSYGDKEEYERSYKEVTEVFRTAIADEIGRRLRGGHPKASCGGSRSQGDALRDAFSSNTCY